MTKDEIYEHLAKVYLGKKKKKKKAPSFRFYALLFINIFVVLGVGVLFFNGLKGAYQKHNRNDIYFSLNQYPLRIKFNLEPPFPQIENFSLSLPEVDLSSYSLMEFNIKSVKEGVPAILKISLENKKREISSYFLKRISKKWQRVVIPLANFPEITDWSNITKIHFVFEAWNSGIKKGTVLIEDIGFNSGR
ncbi:MAG: hypothetical protein Q8O13_03055 [Candidatus Omnitrophota bacterium]|nr:hypothetical protein [Candidatus Omnitrophota bacterium]